MNFIAPVTIPVVGLGLLTVGNPATGVSMIGDTVTVTFSVAEAVPLLALIVKVSITGDNVVPAAFRAVTVGV